MFVLIQIVINSLPNRRLIGYKGVYQLQDIIPNLFTAGFMCVVSIVVGKLSLSPALLMFVQIIVGASTYLALAIISKNKSLMIILDLVKKYTAAPKD